MNDTIQATLAHWTDFYLVTGTAAATLTGLQFIVQTLLASDTHRALGGHDPEGGIGAFGTPTVVHFTLALVLSAVMCAWWPAYTALRTTLGVLGAGALVYSVLVLQRARRQRNYVPTIEDWVWYLLLPAAAYIAVVLAALFLAHGADGALFTVAAATLLLVCIGIHNAWDTVTYLTVNTLRSAASDGEGRSPDVE